MRRVQFLLLGLLLAGCTRDKGGNASASAYTSDSDSSIREDGLAGTNSGAELEAPRLIPAVKNQLELMSQGNQVNSDNLTAYKNLAGDLITSMQADLHRVGYADSGHLRALSDSILNDVGGGTGTASGPKPSEMSRHVGRMRRLIGLYQQTMRGAANRL